MVSGTPVLGWIE